MFSYTLFSMLFATCTLAAPNALGFMARHEVHDIAAPVPAPVRRAIAFSPHEYAALPTVNATSVVTVTTTVTATPTASEFSSTTTTTTTTSGSQPAISVFPEPEPEPEEKAGVYICSDHTWGGTCEHKLTPLGSSDDDCTPLDGNASSIGPDIGFHCIFYTNAFCRSLLSDGSDTLELDYPGSPNLLVTDKGDFNDKIHSYLCFKADPVETDDEDSSASSEE